MDAAVAMIEKGARAMQQRLITFAQKIEPNININPLQAPAITFQVDLEEMVQKFVSAMTETAYEHYLVWYDFASKGKKLISSMGRLYSSRALFDMVHFSSQR
jgi:hypothetical protein